MYIYIILYIWIGINILILIYDTKYLKLFKIKMALYKVTITK